MQHTMTIHLCELQQNNTNLVSNDRSSLPCPVMKRKTVKAVSAQKDVYQVVTDLI